MQVASTGVVQVSWEPVARRFITSQNLGPFQEIASTFSAGGLRDDKILQDTGLDTVLESETIRMGIYRLRYKRQRSRSRPEHMLACNCNRSINVESSLSWSIMS